MDLVTRQARLLNDYRLGRDRAIQAGTCMPIAPALLHMVPTGTAGTDKTVVINEMARRNGGKKFKLMAPTGNPACGIRGKVRLRLFFPYCF